MLYLYIQMYMYIIFVYLLCTCIQVLICSNCSGIYRRLGVHTYVAVK